MNAIIPASNAQMTLYQDAATNPAAVYLASVSASSRRVMASALSAIAEIATGEPVNILSVPWHALRYQHTAAIRSMLAERYSPTTANRHLSALRGVLKECWRLGYTDAESYHRAIDLKPIRGGDTASAAEKGRHLSHGEILALSAACEDGSRAGARDRAMLAIAVCAGLRRAEVASLNVDDFDSQAGTIHVVKGKGAKDRIVPINAGAVQAVTEWLEVRGMEPGPLFLRVRRGDHIWQERLTPQAVQVIFDDLADAAGIASFTPHDCRRTMIGNLLDAGADLATVAKIAGHSRADTTAGYDRRGQRAKRDAADRLSFPARHKA